MIPVEVLNTYLSENKARIILDMVFRLEESIFGRGFAWLREQERRRREAKRWARLQDIPGE